MYVAPPSRPSDRGFRCRRLRERLTDRPPKRSDFRRLRPDSSTRSRARKLPGRARVSEGVVTVLYEPLSRTPLRRCRLLTPLVTTGMLSTVTQRFAALRASPRTSLPSRRAAVPNGDARCAPDAFHRIDPALACARPHRLASQLDGACGCRLGFAPRFRLAASAQATFFALPYASSAPPRITRRRESVS